MVISRLKLFFLTFITTVVFLQLSAVSQDRNLWQKITSQQRVEVEQFASDYKKFLAKAKTELSFVREAADLCESNQFQKLREGIELQPGGRYYDINRDRTISLIVMGRKPIEEGVHIVGAHIDSPRLELKPRALYEKEGFVLFQTNYHGGLKTYQWTNIPLALSGRVDRKDGTTIWISVGDELTDPVFMIPDLAPHVDNELRGREYREVIQYEELDPIAGHIRESEEVSLKESILNYLKTSYGIEEDDFVSSELSLVPAQSPRDIGFDRGLMALYGQDDRLSAYCALRALMDTENPETTIIAYLVDNEEVGNINNTGARSSYLVDLLGRLLSAWKKESFRELDLRKLLKKTRAISSDVNPGIHPTWPSAFEKGNAPRLGQGVNLKLYGRGFNANSEYIAWTRSLFDSNSIPWQTVTYKVGRGGGGTIGGSMSDDNMEVIDIGVPVLSIHTPCSISSKVDVFFLYSAMKAFFGYTETGR
jgi:aspartyl aminopeptidase